MPVNQSPKLKNPSKIRRIEDTSFDNTSPHNMSAMDTDVFQPPPVDANDIPAALNTIMAQLSNLTLQITNMGNKFEAIEEQLNTHSQEIKELKQSSSNVNDDVILLKGRINVLEQKDFDDDLIIGGFDTQPGSTVITELCRHYNFDPGNISHHFSFRKRQKSNTSTQKYNLIVCFRSKQAQMHFRDAVKEFGKLSAGTLTDVAGHKPKGGDLITVSNRYSYVFRSINYKLGLLKNEGKIHAIKYRNCCMYIQETENTKFTAVSTMEWLDSFIEKTNANHA